MDDCGEYEVLPGVLNNDSSNYEFRKQLSERLDTYCHSWKYQGGESKYWEFQGMSPEFFTSLYSPYVYHKKEKVEDIYEEKYSKNYLEVNDPYFNLLMNINVHALEENIRSSVLIILSACENNQYSLEFKYGIGQFLPFPAITHNKKLWVKSLEYVTGAPDFQTIQEAYCGNTNAWDKYENVKELLQVCPKKEWAIKELNTKLNEGHCCITTMDILNRLLLMIDLCSNVDFFIWAGHCIEYWLTWSEIACESMSLRQIQDIEENDENFVFSDMLQELKLLKCSRNMFRRPNVYLGTFQETLQKLKPFATQVANGVFTLEGA